MSQISDVAAVHIALADYAAIDQSGKINTIGAGSIIIKRAITEQSTPIFLLATITVPPSCYGLSSEIEITLESADGSAPEIPGPSGDLEPFRFSSQVTFDEPQVPQVPGYLNSQLRIIISFSGGLPLPVNNGYLWRVHIDGEARDQWTERFIITE